MASNLKRLIPLANRVLIKPLMPENVTKSGIILKTDTSKTTHGVVMEVGQGELNKAGTINQMQVKIGDIVLLPDYGGVKVEVQGVKYQLFRDQDIIGILSR